MVPRAIAAAEFLFGSELPVSLPPLGSLGDSVGWDPPSEL